MIARIRRMPILIAAVVFVAYITSLFVATACVYSIQFMVSGIESGYGGVEYAPYWVRLIPFTVVYIGLCPLMALWATAIHTYNQLYRKYNRLNKMSRIDKL